MASIEEKNKSLVLEAFDTLQQTGLRGGHAILVAEIHPAQRPHRAGSRKVSSTSSRPVLRPSNMSRV
jgi:hypothetical protein